MRKLVLVFGLLIVRNNAQAEIISYSSIPFHSVDCVGGSNTFIHFEAVINERLRDVAVNLDQVEMKLNEDSENYTTLDLIDVTEDSSLWLKARKAVVVIRNKNDFEVWKKFLIQSKKEQELDRKRFLEPRRVLPR